MKQTRYIVYTFILLMIVVVVCACRRERPVEQKPTATAQGGCPKLEGSFFGVDKSTIKKGETINVSWKIPREYAATAKVEGLYQGRAADISSAVNQADGDHFEGKLPAKPQQSTKLVLTATGPDGCTKLELPAQVEVE